MLLLVFLISIAVLLFCIIKLKLNAFVALMVCAYGTGLMALATYAGGTTPAGFASIGDIVTTITNNFGSTLGSIGIVTGLGVMLGMFMYESGGIDSIVDKVLKAVGPKRSQYAVSVAGFITGIPVFGDVVYIMFAPMLRVLSRETKYSMTAYGCAISVATTCTFALVLPTAPPLTVAAAMGINVGIFFYALIAAFVGMFAAAIVSGAAAASGVSPILCAIAVCAGGIGLSLPNDSGFWAISRFFHLNEVDTIRGWTLGGFVAGVSILIFACILSLFQGFLPGLVV